MRPGEFWGVATSAPATGNRGLPGGSSSHWSKQGKRRILQSQRLTSPLRWNNLAWGMSHLQTKGICRRATLVRHPWATRRKLGRISPPRSRLVAGCGRFVARQLLAAERGVRTIQRSPGSRENDRAMGGRHFSPQGTMGNVLSGSIAATPRTKRGQRSMDMQMGHRGLPGRALRLSSAERYSQDSCPRR